MSAIAKGAIITKPRRATLLARIMIKAKSIPPSAATATPATGINPSPALATAPAAIVSSRMSPVEVGLIAAVEAKGATIRSLAPSAFSPRPRHRIAARRRSAQRGNAA